MIKVSVIMPIYNKEEYLKRSIESILNQSLKDIEIILIDDGSIDRSGELCEEYAKKNNNITVIHKKNGGVSSARNVGIENANGKFITFVDPDDSLEVDAVEYLYNLANTYACEIGCYKMNTFINNTIQKKDIYAEKIKVYKDREIINEYSKNGTFLYSVCNKIYLKSLIKDIRFSEEVRYAEDALFNYEVMCKSNKLICSNLRKYNYYINNNSTVVKLNEKRLDVLEAQKRIYFILCENYNECLKFIENQYINSSLLIGKEIAMKSNSFSREYLRILHNLKIILNDTRSKQIVSCFNNISIDKILYFILSNYPIIFVKLYKIKIKLNNIAK